MVSEKDRRAYYQKKIKLVRALDDKWREIASATPSRAMKCIPAAEELVRQLDEIDQHPVESRGDPTDTAPDRELLRQTLLSAVDTLMQAKARLEDLKKDLGKRLSDLRSRQRGTSHGRFDRSG